MAGFCVSRNIFMLVKHNIYFQNLNFDTQTEIIQKIVNYLICEEGLNDMQAQEQADYYINTHNWVFEYAI